MLGEIPKQAMRKRVRHSIRYSSRAIVVFNEILICCCLLYVSLTAALVLHRNGALVPEDTAEVLAAQDLHLQALSLLDISDDQKDLLVLDELQSRGILQGLWSAIKSPAKLWGSNPVNKP